MKKTMAVAVVVGLLTGTCPAGFWDDMLGGWGQSGASVSVTVNTGDAVVGNAGVPEIRFTQDFGSWLLPYGVWFYVIPYGWVWQPQIATNDPYWRPYCHGGRWVWTTAGWFWQSSYSWGWAAFHYGRWIYVSSLGWMWVPDVVWAPAWVVWRGTDTYWGWAPLPPAASYPNGQTEQTTSARADFGLADHHFTFVPRHSLQHSDLTQVLVSRQDVPTVYGHSVRRTAPEQPDAPPPGPAPVFSGRPAGPGPRPSEPPPVFSAPPPVRRTVASPIAEEPVRHVVRQRVEPPPQIPQFLPGERTSAAHPPPFAFPPSAPAASANSMPERPPSSAMAVGRAPAGPPSAVPEMPRNGGPSERRMPAAPPGGPLGPRFGR